jgi:hypothetical protein
MELIYGGALSDGGKGDCVLESQEAKDELNYQHCYYYNASFFFVFMLMVIIFSFVVLPATQMKMNHVFRILYKGSVLRHDDEFRWFELH